MRRCRRQRAKSADSGDNTSMLYIPDDIIFDILVRIPARRLVALQKVCKSWRNIIRSREFSQASSRYWKPRRVISEIDRIYEVEVLPVENSVAMKKWIEGEFTGKAYSGLVRGHLSWCGWTFSRPPIGMYRKREMRCQSPEGKIYTSLIRACKAQSGLL